MEVPILSAVFPEVKVVTAGSHQMVMAKTAIQATTGMVGQKELATRVAAALMQSKVRTACLAPLAPPFKVPELSTRRATTEWTASQVRTARTARVVGAVGAR